jgi:hypothetical protein
MTRAANPVDQLQAEVNRAALHAGPAIAALARAGYAAKGVVYVLIGGLAFLASIGSRADTPGSKGALRTLVDEPYGRVMLTVVAIGLAGYALWCFVRAIFDPERDGTGFKGLGKRAFHFLKGVVHVLLVWAVVNMVRGAGGGGGDDDGVRDWTAWLMSFPAGVYLVGAIGLGILGYGIRQVHKGWTADLDDQLSLGQMNRTAAHWTVHFSRFGMAARGIVFCVIGAFLVTAAYHANPSEAKGVGEVLAAVERQPYGPVLLGAVAAGLVAYGAYQFILARYRRIERP